MSDVLLALRAASFGHGDRRVLEAVDLELRRGERVALLGANGAGKTTLLHLLVGLVRPNAGQVFAFGRERCSERDFVEVRRKAGLLFQDSDDQLFCPTVIEDVAFGPLNMGHSEREARHMASEVLERLGLATLAGRVTHRLSGGEKRLVALAAVLAMKPEVLLLDEPTNGLDEAAEARLLAQLEASGLSMLLVSHERRIVERLGTRAVLLEGGRLQAALLHRHVHHHSHLHVHAAGHPADHTHEPGAPDP